MGGDHAPEAIVRGVLDASSEVKHKIFLVGDIERLKMLMPNKMPQNVELIHASECIEMSEKPMEALRKKRDSSISVGIDLVKNIDVMHFAVGDADKRGDVAMQIQQGVHLDGGFALAELGPRE